VSEAKDIWSVYTSFFLKEPFSGGFWQYEQDVFLAYPGGEPKAHPEHISSEMRSRRNSHIDKRFKKYF